MSTGPERRVRVRGDRPAAVAGVARQIGIGGAAQALARRQHGDGLEQVGLAGAVGADQHLRLGAGLERQMAHSCGSS